MYQASPAAQLVRLLNRPPPTAEQGAVIEAELAPLLVVAGAGSGKTETMAARVVYVVAAGHVQPEHVLGLTFTRKAAGQLRNRISRGLRALAQVPAAQWPNLPGAPQQGAPDRSGWAHAGVTVSTYHAFAGAILGEFGALVGVAAQAPVLSETAAWQLARASVGSWEGELEVEVSADRVTDAVLQLAGTLADHLVDGVDLAAYLTELIDQFTTAPPSPRQRKPVHSGLAGPLRQLSERRWILPLVQAYTDAKRQAGVIDFADQMSLAARVVTEHPAVADQLRERFPLVLLDEYQDTGHAQRIILRTIFGRGHAITAVGDPVQSIYTWRGASASNLVRFATDFTQADGQPASRRVLTQSFRNPPQVLRIANTLSEPVRGDLPELTSFDQGRVGQVEITEALTDVDEYAHLATRIAEVWADSRQDGRPEPTTAVLCRRRSAMTAIARALQDRGVPTHIVGVGGLLTEPAVADLYAILQLIDGGDADAAMLRILTGPRWRIGVADVQALADRASELNRAAGHAAEVLGVDVPAPGTPRVDSPGRSNPGADTPGPGGPERDPAPVALITRSRVGLGLVHALDDLGRADRYSAQGQPRLAELAGELRQFRARRSGLAELVAEVERQSLLDIQANLAGPTARAMLDEFADVVADFAATGGQLPEFLDYLRAAADREDGLGTETGSLPSGAVSIMTVHAAKGLEFEVVAIPAMVTGAFPARKTSTWISEASSLPPALRGDRLDLPELTVPHHADQAELAAVLAGHRQDLAQWSAAEELRLAYVALTRAERVLLVSAHHWSAGRSRPSGPSELFAQIEAAAAMVPGARVTKLADEVGSTNPLAAQPRTASWPLPPDMAQNRRRQAARQVQTLIQRLAEVPLTTAAVPTSPAPPTPSAATPANLISPAPPTIPAPSAPSPPTSSAAVRARRWIEETDLLLRGWQQQRRNRLTVPQAVPLPPVLPVSALVAIDADAPGYATALIRPVPRQPAPHARRGTAFHQWLEQRFAGLTLLDMDELPGSDDRDALGDDHLHALQEAFETSSWSTRTPIAVEVGFTLTVSGLTLRGRIDAVFAEPDGTTTVLDWKTGRRPPPARLRQVDVQLAAYRLAWAAQTGQPLEQVRAAAHYVISNDTYRPADLPTGEELARIVTGQCAGWSS